MERVAGRACVETSSRHAGLMAGHDPICRYEREPRSRVMSDAST
ncbi:hypothetical protein P355_1872 [Burkholderia cenocepacia KC-01]|nr:hypothetical protein P355_1872 [Burkholderia cenocepacia KC-01]